MRINYVLVLLALGIMISCSPGDMPYVHEEAWSFTEISSIDIGEGGAAEITAYDEHTKKLFVVTNAGSRTQIDVIDLTNPAAPVLLTAIDVAPFGGHVNSVAVYDGHLAAAIEGFVKTDPGKVVVFNTTDHMVVRQVPVGAQPDMIAYSYDGKYILTANEGEPNDSYTIDPVGSVSIISARGQYHVVDLDFGSFASQLPALQAKGFRVFGPGATFAQDVEPEYLAISPDSKFAWVTLQENNGIAKIDIRAKKILSIFPLGFKNYQDAHNAIDPSDRDGGIFQNTWSVKGMYQPDAIAVWDEGGIPFLFTANEGDVREWPAFAENRRVKDLTLDALAFPDATIKQDAKLGRLNVTNTKGDAGNDGDFEELYSFGARSFSVWNGSNGDILYDSKNELEQKCITAGRYDDARSDDKGVEPEGIALGLVGRKKVVFVGMERADALAIYDVSNPYHPKFLKLLPTGDGPEGITFVPAQVSPVGRSLVIVSSENDGVIKIYRTN